MAPKIFEAKKESLVRGGDSSDLATEADLPPIVARLVVEIRSDGTRTIARGAMEDLQTGERVSLQANAASPVALAKELTKTLLKTPVLASAIAKQTLRDMIPKKLLSKLPSKKRKKT